VDTEKERARVIRYDIRTLCKVEAVVERMRKSQSCSLVSAISPLSPLYIQTQLVNKKRESSHIIPMNVASKQERNEI